MNLRYVLFVTALCFLSTARAASDDAPLPPGVRAVWDLGKAWRETTPTRERICLNGLWRFQPGEDDTLPTGTWGWFKVPGPWPGITDYMQKDTQSVIAHAAWKGANFAGLTSAWYQREFIVPLAWKGRRITLETAYVNSLAVVYLDGMPAGNISFPEGKLDLTTLVKPGTKQALSIQVIALPLQGVMTSYTDTNAAKQMKATVARRGLCGDVFLASTPARARIDDVEFATSVRKGLITVRAAMVGVESGKSYTIQGRILDHGREVKRFAGGRFLGTAEQVLSIQWKPDKLWDLDTPQNQYDLELSLHDGSGRVLDVLPPKRFGYRELWIDGRDFILNGTRVFWSCVPMDNAQISPALASYEGARESMRRLKSIGINMVYTHNYDCNPGSYLSFDELLRAADDVGMLVALTQPHFGNYDWSAPDAEGSNGYARHAAFFARVAGSHPSVVAYSTSHNACGYNEDMNPDLIDGLYDQRDQWALNNMRQAVRAETIIHALDSSRIVYHHSSGNLGTMHTMNFYLNMAPIQEVDDWFEHWATKGVKPAFTVEYGVPFSWDWAMYRGWYAGTRTFGSAAVPWEYCMAEWNAQFLGDDAYRISQAEQRNLRWEAQKFRANQLWHRWDYPQPMGSTHSDFEDQQKVWASYTTDNWRAFRTWGVSGISPWEIEGEFWRLKPGVERKRVELATDWDALQRPGYSPDFIDGRYERMDLAFAASDWEPTTGGLALLRNNAPLLAYIGGKPDAFTEKGHNFRAGESVDKQLIVVNNSREAARCTCAWSLGAIGGTVQLQIPTGSILKSPLHLTLPANLAPGQYQLKATFSFSNGLVQEDSLALDVLPKTLRPVNQPKLAIYDPTGETTKLLAGLGVAGTAIAPGQDLAGYQVLIIGKRALSTDGPGLDLLRVRQGLKVIVFEQGSDVLEKRFGFRVQEYGLRNVFVRVPGHPAVAGLDAETLRDWRGEATLLPPRMQYELSNKYNGAPAIMRSGLLVTRAWRAGCRGNVASVLIEKPAKGDFTSLLDGGFSLQYTPLMEYREGLGMVIFCQVDVTGRTESDPAGEQLVTSLLGYVSRWKPQIEGSISYLGDPAGREYLERAGYKVVGAARPPTSGQVLVVGPGVGVTLGDQVKAWRGAGGRVIALGLAEDELRLAMGNGVEVSAGEYIDGAFKSPPFGTIFAGTGPADLHNRDPRMVALVGGEVLGASRDGQVIALQLAPWSFDLAKPNTRRVFRHTSVALSRILGNLGVRAATPLIERITKPAAAGEKRWLEGFYLDQPEEWDDPYRFFRW